MKWRSETTSRLMAGVLGLVFLGASAASADVLYVDDDASTNGDGQSWTTAFKYLQDALAEASTNGVATEIRVAAGIYTPDRDESGNMTSADREATFQLISDVEIYGGYAGIGAPDPDLRDMDSNASVLSGDLAGDDGPDFANSSENSYHVVTGSDVDTNAVLDGFTITAGLANGFFTSIQQYGGGMYSSSSSPTLTNCTFSGNLAIESGGGMYSSSSSPTLTNCIFSGNSTYNRYGGGMCNRDSNPALTNCTFSGNSAPYGHGGGMYNYLDSSPTLTNCTFSGNSADGDGGGM
ncbi:MAG: right-handed parallel beta-helix repeat-containing protein, partial [bacterium]|nr:right-handed parallel beta-helix repeat-containing protein [bacterium]